jgi:hypothetical protein
MPGPRSKPISDFYENHFACLLQKRGDYPHGIPKEGGKGPTGGGGSAGVREEGAACRVGVGDTGGRGHREDSVTGTRPEKFECALCATMRASGWRGCTGCAVGGLHVCPNFLLGYVSC